MSEPMVELARQARAGAVSYAIQDELLQHPPSPQRLEAQFADLVPIVNDQARFGLAILAIGLVARNKDFRKSAEIAIVGGTANFYLDHGESLCMVAEELCDDNVLWWHDLFCRTMPKQLDFKYRDLLVAHGSVLLRERQQAVLDYLLTPDRGPAGNNVVVFEEVIKMLDGCPPLERRWMQWIEHGRFERRQVGDEFPSFLGLALVDGLATQPEVYQPLLNSALSRWRQLLTDDSEAERDRGLESISALLMDRVTFGGRLIHEVIDRLAPERVPLLFEMRRAALAAWRAEIKGEGRSGGDDETIMKFYMLVHQDRKAQ